MNRNEERPLGESVVGKQPAQSPGGRGERGTCPPGAEHRDAGEGGKG